jgi:hypothetical protein
MSVREAIASIHADQTLDEAQRRAAVYRFKVGLLLDVIRTSDLLGRAYTHAGASYLIREVMAGPADQLIFAVEINGEKHTIHIVNPPLIPRAPTGDERRDMLQAVREMLEGFGV